MLFDSCVDCSVRNVRTHRTGESGLTLTKAKRFEARNCVFNETWYPYVGSTGYVQFANCQDCLMENITATYLRHVDLQSGAAGSVIRRSFVAHADIQSHQGFATGEWLRCDAVVVQLFMLSLPETLWESIHLESDQTYLWYDNKVNYSASTGSYYRGYVCVSLSLVSTDFASDLCAKLASLTVTRQVVVRAPQSVVSFFLQFSHLFPA